MLEKVRILDLIGFEHSEDEIKEMCLEDVVNELCERCDYELKNRNLNGINNYSRYEVLGDVRRIYVDIDGEVLDVVKNVVSVDEVVERLKRFILDVACAMCESEDDMQALPEPLISYTINTNSPHCREEENHTTHHIVVGNYCMSNEMMEKLIYYFLFENKIVKGIDFGIYDKNRLFKLPYYVGIVSGCHLMSSDKDNYHHLYYSDYEWGEDALAHMIIQDTSDCIDISDGIVWGGYNYVYDAIDWYRNIKYDKCDGVVHMSYHLENDNNLIDDYMSGGFDEFYNDEIF